MEELKIIARIDLSNWGNSSLVRLEKYPHDLYYGHLNSGIFYDVNAEEVERSGKELLNDLVLDKIQAIVFHDWNNTESILVESFEVNNNNYLTIKESSLFIGTLSSINFPEKFIPKVSSEVFDSFGNTLEAIVNSWLEYSISLLGKQDNFKFEAKNTTPCQGHIESIFQISALNSIDTTKWKENGSDHEEFESKYFEVSLGVYTLTYATLVVVDDVYLPNSMRNQGRFTHLLTTIKEFLVTNRLGDEIIMIDASEDGITDYVAEKVGLWCDAFGQTKHRLY